MKKSNKVKNILVTAVEVMSKKYMFNNKRKISQFYDFWHRF